MRRYEVTEELIAAAAKRVVELGWCKPGDRVGITAGPAVRQAGHDVAAADPRGLTCSSGPRTCERIAAGRDHAGVPALGAPAGQAGLAAAHADRRDRVRRRRGRRDDHATRTPARPGSRRREQVEAAMPPRRPDPPRRAAPRRARTRGSRCARPRPTTRCSRARPDGPVDVRVPARDRRAARAVRAGDLAESVGRERLRLQARRPQAQGARPDRVSLEPGYRLSPRGQLDAELARRRRAGTRRPDARSAQRAIVTSSDGVQAQLDAAVVRRRRRRR